MSDEVQFEDENAQSYSSSLKNEYAQEVGALENLVIRTGIVQDKNSAKHVLVAIIIVCFVATIFVVMWSGLIHVGSSGESQAQMIQDARNAQAKLGNNYNL